MIRLQAHFLSLTVLLAGMVSSVLDKPVRSEDLRLLGPGQPKGVRVCGLFVGELPEHEGFKRHLEFTH